MIDSSGQQKGKNRPKGEVVTFHRFNAKGIPAVGTAERSVSSRISGDDDTVQQITELYNSLKAFILENPFLPS